jgi:sulfur carrier protein
LGDNACIRGATVGYDAITNVNGGITADHGRTTGHRRRASDKRGEGSVPTIVMRIPKRQEIALDGRCKVSEALRELGITPETVLVIKGNRLLTRDAWIEADDVVEVRPVMSGGS